MTNSHDRSLPLSVLVPRILIGLSILLLLYFTQVTYRFKGTYDESFLAPENLELIRGPLANEEYYRMGELDYQGKDPFEDAEPGESGNPSTSAAVETTGNTPPEEIRTATEPQEIPTP